MDLFSMHCVFIFMVFTYYTLAIDILESEQATFFGFTHEIKISSSTLELVERLDKEVSTRRHGDRKVKRYFDSYDTPFLGHRRRMNYDNY